MPAFGNFLVAKTSFPKFQNDVFLMEKNVNTEELIKWICCVQFVGRMKCDGVDSTTTFGFAISIACILAIVCSAQGQ